MIPRRLAWLALNHIPGAGAVTLLRLASRFGSPEAALEATTEELIAVGSLTPAQATALRHLAADGRQLEKLEQRLQEAGIWLVTADDEAYPTNLRGLRDAPPLLYVRGSLAPADATGVAIVGTRSPSQHGASVAADIARSLAGRGITVVSGLALGVDGAAHRGALAAAGRTVAVLGSGLERVTPSRHRNLAEEVAGAGALVSEMPTGTRASRETLLARNRIQAGLARAVVVAQCRRGGGSFATAKRALQAGRPVLAVTWEESEFAAGVERLKTMGARAASAPEVARLAAQAAFDPLPRPPQLPLNDAA
jgi:DNA processing protein